MAYNAKNGNLRLGARDMDYISFGSGAPLVMIPGLGDGLKTVKGTASAFSMLYREFAKKHSVYVFSRVNQLNEGATTRDMARDLKAAMDELGIAGADVLGVSQGGMIAQYLAIDYPEAVKRLVLTVTLARPNETIEGVFAGWLDMAARGDHKGIFIDTSERAYSEEYLKKYRKMYPVAGLMSKPKDMGRFVIQARSCVTHDACGELGKINCPTLVIGGGRDAIVGAEAARELHERIPGSELYVYDNYGHALYEEAKDFNARVLEFLER